MNAALKETVTHRLEQSRATLNTALENGDEDTQQLREQIAEDEHNLQMLNDDEAALQAVGETNIEVTMEKQACREIEKATTALVAELRDLVEIPAPDVSLPVGVVLNVQRAGYVLQTAQEAITAAKERVDKLESRKTEIETACQAIIRNRMAGNGDDERDSQRIALCDADLKGLAPMTEEARAGLQTAQAAGQQAQQIFDQATSQWGQAVNAERQRTLDVLSQRIDELWVKVVALTMPQPGAGFTGYQPSMELRTILLRFGI